MMPALTCRANFRNLVRCGLPEEFVFVYAHIQCYQRDNNSEYGNWHNDRIHYAEDNRNIICIIPIEFYCFVECSFVDGTCSIRFINVYMYSDGLLL